MDDQRQHNEQYQIQQLSFLCHGQLLRTRVFCGLKFLSPGHGLLAQSLGASHVPVERGFLIPSELLHQRVEGFRRTDRQSIFSKLLFSVSIFLTGAKNTVKLLSGQAHVIIRQPGMRYAVISMSSKQ